jgi:hypothetical protein
MGVCTRTKGPTKSQIKDPEYWHADYEEEWTPPENQVEPELNTQFHGHAGDGAEDVPAQMHQVLEAEVEDDAYQDDVEEPNRHDPPPDLVSDSSDEGSDTNLDLSRQHILRRRVGRGRQLVVHGTSER